MGIIERRIEIELDRLIFSRTNVEELNKKVSEITDCVVNFEDITKDDDELADYNLLGSFENKTLYGYIDIYYLKMRCDGFDGSNILITGITVEFE